MALKDALDCLKGKHILGEYGPCTRPFVVLDVEEHAMIIEEIQKSTRRKRVPSESFRSESQAV